MSRQVLTIHRKEMTHALLTALSVVGTADRLFGVKLSQENADTARIAATDAKRIFKTDLKALPQNPTVNAVTGLLHRGQIKSFLAGLQDTVSPNCFVSFEVGEPNRVDDIPRATSIALGADDWYVKGICADEIHKNGIYDSLLTTEGYLQPYTIDTTDWIEAMPLRMGQKPTGDFSTSNTVLVAFEFGRRHIPIGFGKADKLVREKLEKKVFEFEPLSERPPHKPFHGFYVGRFFKEMLEGVSGSGLADLYVKNSTEPIHIVQDNYHAALMPIALWEHVDMDEKWKILT